MRYSRYSIKIVFRWQNPFTAHPTKRCFVIRKKRNEFETTLTSERLIIVDERDRFMVIETFSSSHDRNHFHDDLIQQLKQSSEVKIII
jgi:hypothetical protein